MSMRVKELEERVKALAQTIEDLTTILAVELPSTQPAQDSLKGNMRQAEGEIQMWKKSMVEEQAPFDLEGSSNTLLSSNELRILLEIYKDVLFQLRSCNPILTKSTYDNYFSSHWNREAIIFNCGDFQRRYMSRPVQEAQVKFNSGNADNIYTEIVNLPISGETIEWYDTVSGKFHCETLVIYFNGLIEEYNKIVNEEGKVSHRSLPHPIEKRSDLEKKVCSTLDVIVGMDTATNHELLQVDGSIWLQFYLSGSTGCVITLERLPDLPTRDFGGFGDSPRYKLTMYYIQDDVIHLNEERIIRQSSRQGFVFEKQSGNFLPSSYSGNVYNDHMATQLINALTHYLRHGELSDIYIYKMSMGSVECHEHTLKRLPVVEEEVDEKSTDAEE